MVAENLITVGILVIIIGFVLVIVGSVLQATKGKTKSEWVVGGILWFIPFGFGSREDLVKFAIIVSIAVLIVFLILNKRLVS